MGFFLLMRWCPERIGSDVDLLDAGFNDRNNRGIVVGKYVVGEATFHK